jgi:hypothetical protein
MQLEVITVGVIVDLLADRIRKFFGEDALQLLTIYEDSYPADIALVPVQGIPNMLDFDLSGGDIKVSGFWYGSSHESVIQKATQDFLMRAFIATGSMRFFPNFGSGPLDQISRDEMPAVIATIVQESPNLDNLVSVGVEEDVIIWYE